jgi:hypothetical protein
MGYRIILKERDINVTVPLTQLNNLFPKKKADYYEWKADKAGEIMIAALTEQGWVAVWGSLDLSNDSVMVNLTAMNASRSFYSRHGYYFLQQIQELCIKYKGNLCLSTKEPETGGGSLTIIYQGKLIHGVFHTDLNHPKSHCSIWADEA